eukprot:13991-Alexandrium_andersonii.AAC.1
MRLGRAKCAACGLQLLHCPCTNQVLAPRCFDPSLFFAASQNHASSDQQPVSQEPAALAASPSSGDPWA